MRSLQEACNGVNVTGIRVSAAILSLVVGCNPAWSRDAATDSAQAAERIAAGEREPLEEVVVFGRNVSLLGIAEAASEGTVGGADLLVRPMLRVAEVLESVPGMVAVQHSGSGKANQYFLRGFNLDHGTDFSLHVDGVPLNLRSHGHGQGYLDINALMPEAIERLDYRKGPYRADTGDFSMAGSSFITTIDRLDARFVAVESGEHGWGRVAAGGTVPVAAGELTMLGEYKTYDGPWQLAENLRHATVWAKYLQPTAFGRLAVSIWGYEGNWHPTEQIPERVIGSPVCADAFCALDTTAGGDTSRWILALNLDGTAWAVSGYFQHYDWFMQSNPTYDFQINQFDRRWTAGGRYRHAVRESAHGDLVIGAELRYDDIGPVGLDEFDAGEFVANISDNDIREASVGAFVEAGWSPAESLRLMAGLRGDHYSFDVASNSPGSFAGDRSDSRASPKLGAAWVGAAGLELYVNWGRGFHSNDARGVVNDAEPVPGLSPGTGYEAGARFEFGDVKLTAAYWWLDLDSELIFVGDSNSVEPKGGSERDGYELTLFWRPRPWLAVDAVYTASDARYKDNSEGRYIEGSVERAGQAGISLVRERWETSLRARYLGPYALTPDNAQRAGSETTVSLRGAWKTRRFTFYAEIFNLLDADGKDIVYLYPAHVAGFDPPGLTSEDIDCALIDCRMSRAEEPRMFRAGIEMRF